ncbi:hypothetical protein ccbrp13_11510 [Ktedonobacteria bacterium brp13]|nr:hypothetical protein ccbrp13_11510 [Ktedonobacteria bacterium brp13]
MDKVRRFLWEKFGVTLDRETRIVGSIVVLSILAAVVFGIFFAITHATLFLLLVVLSASAAGIVAIGSCYSSLSWSLGSKEERKEIEEEIALKQWRRRARDTHYEP